MHGMVLNQPLVTGQVSHCTGEGFASVYLIAICLVVGVATHKPLLLIDIWIFGILGYDPG